MAERARKIEVVRHGNSAPEVTIDGRPVPWEIDPSGVRAIAAEGYQPGITLTIPADIVQVTDSVEPAVPEEERRRVHEHLQSKAPPSSWRPNG